MRSSESIYTSAAPSPRIASSSAALRESRNLLQLFIEQAPVSIAMYDTQMRYLAASRVHLERYKLIGKEYVGRVFFDLLPFLPDSWMQPHLRCLNEGKIAKGEDCIDLPDGTKEWLQWELHPWYTGEGAIGGLVAFSIDITDRKQADEKQRLAAQVFTHAREAIMITDAGGRIIDVNDMFIEITGYEREEVVGHSPRLLKSGRQKKEFYTEMWRQLTEKGCWSGEIWNRHKEGHIFAEILTISAVPNEDGCVQQYVALFSDITNIKEQEQRLKQIAHYDAITGLPNRVLLTDRLNMAMTQFRPVKDVIAESRRSGKLMSVAYLDLDSFKEINDRYGHDVGDKLLAAVAGRMKSAMRKRDTVARVGGDEFVAVMLDLESRESCKPMLDRLINAASRPVKIGKHSIQISVSIGVTFYPQTEDVAADQLMRQADQAMYQAKLAGKNRYHIFDFDQDRSARGRHVDLDRIRHALPANEFLLYYQPLVNMREGKVVGAEALIRWQHPDRGLLLPGVFLPVIEDHPFAVEIGEWVIDTALAQMEHWREAGLRIPVSVNVSARQLREPDFAERLGGLLAAHPSIAPPLLTLEIVETSALQDLGRVSQVLESCRRLGVSLALDDFGTGYSSLSYFRHLPANVLKIDWTFVRDILTDPDDLTIIEGIIGLTSAFRRQIVAEGVESVEHGLILLRLGCELAQGFGIARPMPAEGFPDWVKNWRADPRWLNVLAANAKERQLLYVAASHRYWLAGLDLYLKGELETLPDLNQNECRFSAWLSENGRNGGNDSPEIRMIDDLHCQVHSMAKQIVRLKGREHELDLMKAGLGDLHEISSQFLSLLMRHKCGAAVARQELQDAGTVVPPFYGLLQAVRDPEQLAH